MQPISEFSDKCYHCGYPVAGQNPAEFLPVRTPLGERYVVGRALEKRADAAIYIGYDKTARAAVLVREFFPDGISQRLSRQIVPIEGQEALYNESLEQFRRQSRIIARMRDLPAIIPVYDMFEENGTMYTIADQVEGVPFRRYLQTLGGHMTWEEARPMFVPLFTSLVSMHAAGLYHLGISPDSVLVDPDNRLRIDGWQLASTRKAGGGLTLVLPAGYAAPEQYHQGEPVSQEADVYALGATMLYALIGEEPPAALDRENKVASLLVPADVAEKWPAHIAPTLVDALNLQADKRIKTVELLRERLTVAPVVEALREDAVESGLDEYSSYHPPESNGTGYKVTVAILGVVCALLAGALIWLLLAGNPFASESGADATTTTQPFVTVTNPDGTPQTNPDGSAVTSLVTQTSTTKNTTVTRSTALQYAVENLVGFTEDDLQNRQLRGNMTVNVKGREYSDTIPVGVIVSQNPMPETFADVNSVIDVYISAGPRQQPIHDVVGWEREAARVYLESLGLRVTEVEVTISSYERGRVDAMSPAPGQLVQAGDEVLLQISMMEPTTTTSTTTTTTTTTWPFF